MIATRSKTTIAGAIHQGAVRLDGSSESARLDAEILLCHVLSCPRSTLFTWPDRTLPDTAMDQFHRLIARRTLGVPVAYLTGRREFWSMDLAVSPDTLIPRPETEVLVDLAINLIPENMPMRIADLGTGTGAIAIAIASERPVCHVTATDISRKALDIARINIEHHLLGNVLTLESDWFTALHEEHFDLIATNPPYIGAGDPRLDEAVLQYEPNDALIAGKEGLEALEHIAEMAGNHLSPGGHLLMEHGPGQTPSLKTCLEALGYTDIRSHHDLSGHDRVIHAQYYNGNQQ